MRDLQKYSQQTIWQLIIGGLLIIIIVGGILIYLFYGYEALISGLICFGAGLLPLVLIFLFLTFLSRLVNDYRNL